MINEASIFIRDYMVYFFTSEFKEIPDDFVGAFFLIAVAPDVYDHFNKK